MGLWWSSKGKKRDPESYNFLILFLVKGKIVWHFFNIRRASDRLWFSFWLWLKLSDMTKNAGLGVCSKVSKSGFKITIFYISYSLSGVQHEFQMGSKVSKRDLETKKFVFYFKNLQWRFIMTRIVWHFSFNQEKPCVDNENEFNKFWSHIISIKKSCWKCNKMF